MAYNELEKYLSIRQLIGWTDNLWNNKAGELWFLGEHNVEEETFGYGIAFLDSEFRKGDKLGQCPTLHECEREHAWDNVIDCPSLCWYIYAHVVPDCDIDDEQLTDIMKFCWGEHRYWENFHRDMVFVQEHKDDIARLLKKVKLLINNFYAFMYRFVKELIDKHSLGSSCSGCSSVLEENKGDKDEEKEYNWYFNTRILFSPASRSRKKSFLIYDFPYTSMLYGTPPCMPNDWALLFSSAAEDFHKTIQKQKKVAMWMPAVLLSYIADESRKQLLGKEEDWYMGRIDFRSRDATWAFHDCIDVSQLNFHINGAAIYNAYMADALKKAKEQFGRTPGCELMTEDDMWECIYYSELKHWNNDCLLNKILPKSVFQAYAQYIDAYFAYFRNAHPCVVSSEDKSIESCKQIEKIDVIEETNTSCSKQIIPHIDDTLYQNILQYIDITYQGYERYPNNYKGRDEEELRDSILPHLQAKFSNYTATGETFNKNGKTDICIKHTDGSNLFIGECKIWKGESFFAEAINQLFDRYVTWHDTKVALIVFVQNDCFTKIISKAKTAIKQHPYFVSSVDENNEHLGSYIFHHAEDHEREIKLELMLYHFNKK